MKKEASDFKETPGPLQKKLRAVGVTIAFLIFVIIFPFILYLLFRFTIFHESLIHIAVRFNSYKMVELLLKNGADPNTKSKPLEFTPLHFASQKGNVPIMDLLIQHGADLNPVDMDNYLAPIHYPISSDNKDAVQLLIDKGAEINPDRNKVRSFPLDRAKRMGNKEIINILIKAGAKGEQKEEPGNGRK